MQTFALNAGEKIIKVEVHYGPWTIDPFGGGQYYPGLITKLLFETSHRRQFGPIGAEDSSSVKAIATAPPDCYLGYIFGTRGWLLHSLAFHWECEGICKILNVLLACVFSLYFSKYYCRSM